MCKKCLVLLLFVVVLSISVSQAATIVWVGQNSDDDLLWVDFLEAQGHTVITEGNWQEIGDAEITTMNNADLVIFGTNGGFSSAFATSVEEADRWNSIEKPILCMNPSVIRGSGNYWKWFSASTTRMNIALSTIEADEPTHPVFAGVSLDASNKATIYTSTTNGIYTVDGLDVGNGTLIAHMPNDTIMLIAYWDAGVETYDGSGVIPPAPRMVFGAAYYAQYCVNADGEIVFINAVNFLLGGAGYGATKPKPKNGAKDIPISNTTLSWTPGPFAYTHDVFFG
ncbi:MAG: hypothetical protein JXA96_01070, partial [Sedimentisphaerales bacterium]|nr:hypothetical protein [Sedimentisphaerales bacterium]